MQTTSITLLAVVTSGPFTSLVKIGIVVLLLLAWAAAAQWVDRDTDVVKTRREQWNLIVVSGAAVASLVLFVVPGWSGSFFAVGVLVWVALAGGAILAYLVHRNGRVQPGARVMTPGHFKRLLKREGSNRPKDTGSRVRISDHAGDHVEFPSDADEALSYKVVQDFLFDLISRRASSADLVPGKERYRLVYRVDGVRTETPDGMPSEDGERAVRYLKKLAGLNVEEIRRPQVGRIEAALLSSDGKAGKASVRTSGTTAGESLRLTMDSDAKVLRLPELGLAKPRLAALTKILNQQTGLLLVSSPSESGLTTTQYAIIRSHDAYMNNIHAIERRPLAKLDNITQTTYEGNNADVNYARMLQTVLRREPDIVLVGECEDRETALIASRAAADDRKIYMGMDAKDSLDALNKYLTFVGDNKLAAKAILGVMNQRLVRVLCDDCREAFEPDPGTLKKLNLPADKIDRFYRPPTEKKLDRKGREILCPTCQGTGYVGRIGVFELLVVDDAVKKLIEAGAPIDRIKAQSRKNRMYYLQETGLLKVIDGKTSMNEILRCLRTGEK